MFVLKSSYLSLLTVSKTFTVDCCCSRSSHYCTQIPTQASSHVSHDSISNTSPKLKPFWRYQLIQADRPFTGLFLSVNWGLWGLDTRSLTSVAARTLHFILQFSSISFVRYPIQNYRRHNICGNLHSWLLVANLLLRRTGFDSRPTLLGCLVDSVAWNRY
jgi:hypothetical protein